MSIGGDVNHVRRMYGASTEQVRSKSELGLVRKKRKKESKRNETVKLYYKMKNFL